MNDETIRNNVIEILKKYLATRKYDILLYLNLLIKLGFAWRRGDKVTIDMSKAEEFPPVGTVDRIRRKLNEEGLYLPDKETQEKREKARGEFKQTYSPKSKYPRADSFGNSQLS